MRIASIAWLCMTGLIWISGCSSMRRTPVEAPLDGTAWVLSSLPARTLIADATPTARFTQDRVEGTDGCNRYSMPFTAQGSSIAIGAMGPSTQMACPEAIMAQAEAFMTALRNAHSFRRVDGSLRLMDARGFHLATFSPQAHALAGTSWDVMNINNGREAVVGVVTGSTVTMAFDSNGRVSGSTGFNQFTASYSVDGETLRITPAAATLRASADPAIDEQEQAFLRALGTVATMQYEGDLLHLRTKDDALAMVLRRQP